MDRRKFLIGTLGAVASGVLAACSSRTRSTAPVPSSTPGTAGEASTTENAVPSVAAFVRNRPGSKKVALTFHASGDIKLADDLLAHLAALNAPVTVFAVGQWLQQNPSMAKKIQSGGHELANHTYTHPSLGQLGASAVRSEITRCRDVLSTQAGSPGKWFRPSGVDTPTPLMLQEAAAAGYRTVIGYDVDSLDYQDPGAKAVVANVRSGLQGGSIVSMHFGHAGTVTAIDDVVGLVRERGFETSTVSDLLA